MKRHILMMVVVAVCVTAACTSSSESGDSWSESYLGPMDRVLDAVIDVLEDEEYLVDADRETGRITAEPSRRQGGQRATLFVRIVEKSGRIRVDVQTRSGFDGPPGQGSRIESSVLEFFHELELRLQGLED